MKFKNVDKRRFVIVVCAVIMMGLALSFLNRTNLGTDPCTMFNLGMSRLLGINQMEMWQADTFDPVTIDRELGWAEEIGMNCMRVYLHHLIWETDKEGFRHNLCRPEFGI